MLILSRRGTRSRRAAFLTSLVFMVSGIGSTSGSCMTGVGSGMGRVGSGSVGASGMVGAGGTSSKEGACMVEIDGASIFGSGKGPFGSPSSPVSPSGTEDGAATGSEKTGSTLVVLVISSIAFCRSLSTV